MNELVNVRIEPKPERKKHEPVEPWEKSSDIRVFNLHEQTPEAIEANELTHLREKLSRNDD